MPIRRPAPYSTTPFSVSYELKTTLSAKMFSVAVAVNVTRSPFFSSIFAAAPPIIAVLAVEVPLPS